MAAETVRAFEALEAQAQQIMSVFTAAGHELVAPAIIQPADVFLDVIGESLRARTYVFNDPDGAELCLRPDLTVPTCRLHLARYGNEPPPGRYCYNGPAFRFQAQGANEAHPREFRQAGIESFGETDREAAEAATIALIVASIEKAGLRDWTLHLGDLGLFRSVLQAAGLSERWKRRLTGAFQRPLSFRESLRKFASAAEAGGRSLPASLLSKLSADKPEASANAVRAHLEANGIELIGTRSASDIAERLIALAEDQEDARLDADAAKLVNAYARVSGPARSSATEVADLLKDSRNGAQAALKAYARRLTLLENAGVDISRATFSAEFGRNLEYYTGLVFEVRHPSLDIASPVAGGGRYDALMRAAGARQDVPAVGGAIHTERLLGAVQGASR